MIRFSLAEWKIKGANLLPFSETRKVWVSRWEYITGNILLGIFIVMGCSFVVNITYYIPNVELACEYKFPTLHLGLGPDEVQNFFFSSHAKI